MPITHYTDKDLIKKFIEITLDSDIQTLGKDHPSIVDMDITLGNIRTAFLSLVDNGLFENK